MPDVEQRAEKVVQKAWAEKLASPTARFPNRLCLGGCIAIRSSSLLHLEVWIQVKPLSQALKRTIWHRPTVHWRYRWGREPQSEATGARDISSWPSILVNIPVFEELVVSSLAKRSPRLVKSGTRSVQEQTCWSDKESTPCLNCLPWRSKLGCEGCWSAKLQPVHDF